MSGIDLIEVEEVGTAEVESTELFRRLMETPSLRGTQTVPGIVIGELIGMSNEGRTPLVLYPGQPGTAGVFARSVVDLYGSHIGGQVVLMFEGGDLAKPIVMGVLRGEGRPLTEQSGQVDVDADGERLIITAKNQLVLRCGKASITLTSAGKVLIQGEYVSTRSSGLNRIKGGAIQLN